MNLQEAVRSLPLPTLPEGYRWYVDVTESNTKLYYSICLEQNVIAGVFRKRSIWKRLGDRHIGTDLYDGLTSFDYGYIPRQAQGVYDLVLGVPPVSREGFAV